MWPFTPGGKIGKLALLVALLPAVCWAQFDLQEIESRIQHEKARFQAAMQEINQLEKEQSQNLNQLEILTEQVANLDSQIAFTKRKIQLVESQLGKMSGDSELLLTEMEKLEVQKTGLVRILKNYFLTLQKLKWQNPAIVELEHESDFPSKMLKQRWQNEQKKIFRSTLLQMQRLEDQLESLNRERNEIESLAHLLQSEKKSLSVQKTAKKNLLAITQGKQENYRQLWEKSKAQMQITGNQIKQLQAAAQEAQAQLDAAFKAQTPAVSRDENEAFEIGKTFETQDRESTFAIWPVANGEIESAFRDRDFKEKFSIENEGVNIACPQLTPVKAVDLGFVLQVNDNDLGYSSVVLAHKNNLLTISGHLASFTVAVGDIVQAGQVIGFSGGVPGTPGAGVLSSGPHLHFAVVQNGERQNPLKFLPAVD